eukprot:CAMPEP_0197025110 /NCGR_PEP_ID=MMETSP1384-20130603/5541_1 /TAXON_ID=29189 /ORGANISM="Ammonia sp." /LENGTH=166 /DNA_ID=CAMNT_0042453601 /DNA_START=130 /DNA_END=630 /DNA_ORIENTATION=+
MGIKVNVDARIAHCCDEHDACYGICGISRDFCDEEFNRCMNKGCGKDQQCLQSASMITMGASLFGCEPYLQGQRDDCDCLEEFEFEQRVTETLKELYGSLDEEHRKTDEELTQIREKYKGKETKLVNNILKKYPKQLIQMVEMNTGKPIKQRKRKERSKRKRKAEL